MLDQERTRRANARRDAHATMLFLLVPLGFYFTATKDAELGVVELIFLVLLLCTVLAAVIFWLMAMKVSGFPAFNEQAFTQHDNTETEHDYADRYLKTRDHLLEQVQEAKRLGTELVTARERCLYVTIVGVFLALLLFLLRIQMMTACRPEKPITMPQQNEAVPTLTPQEAQSTTPAKMQAPLEKALGSRDHGQGEASRPNK